MDKPTQTTVNADLDIYQTCSIEIDVEGIVTNVSGVEIPHTSIYALLEVVKTAADGYESRRKEREHGQTN